MARKKTRKTSATGARPGARSARAADGPERADARRTEQCIVATARAVHARIRARKKPELKSPTRALSNVRYDERVGYFELGRGRKSRTLTVNTVKSFAQTLKMMALSREMITTSTFATKREAYYVSKNWEDARFEEQVESDTVMDDVEAMFSLQGVSREQLRFYPEEHGGSVAGELVVLDRDPATGHPVEVDCTRFGSGAYTIPHSVEHLGFRTRAKFVLAIETGGMFQRLQSHGFSRQAGAILVELGGVPTRATRRFIRRLSDAKNIPVYAFVDCDPYGISNIYRTLKVGSGNAAHINQFFCVPRARFLGVTPQDILDYELPTHPLKDVDVKRARDALQNDPFFRRHKPWREALELLLKMGQRAEQQALAKWGLNYVIDEYLPRKLRQTDTFLP
ncbi:MAG: DNA topoisomerase IV subunit A [Planctomycetes bacterium]|nr:DNA topoisomerase IV subunit A [Planctomycetota bacterium]